MSRQRIKLGDILAIPLPDGKYAFGRVMEDAGFAVYEGKYESIRDFDKARKYSFIVGIYRNVLTDGKWPVIDNVPFKMEEDAWPPPSCVIDQITGECRIYHKGEIRELKPGEEEICLHMEVTSAWDRNHIVDRIMGDTKWEDLVWRVRGVDIREKIKKLVCNKNNEGLI